MRTHVQFATAMAALWRKDPYILFLVSSFGSRPNHLKEEEFHRWRWISSFAIINAERKGKWVCPEEKAATATRQTSLQKPRITRVGAGDWCRTEPESGVQHRGGQRSRNVTQGRSEDPVTSIECTITNVSRLAETSGTVHHNHNDIFLHVKCEFRDALSREERRRWPVMVLRVRSKFSRPHSSSQRYKQYADDWNYPPSRDKLCRSLCSSGSFGSDHESESTANNQRHCCHGEGEPVTADVRRS